MGKIFGIADLPVSTIMTPFEPLIDFKPPFHDETDFVRENMFNKQQPDTFVSKTRTIKSNPVTKMRNGFGKLMKHFSKK